MNTKTAVIVSTLLVTAGISIGFCAHTGHPAVTQLVGVPIRVSTQQNDPAAKVDLQPSVQTPAMIVTPVTPLVQPAAAAAAAAAAPAAPVLKYTATKGDTVGGLADSLMGADTQANRDAIVNANPSLKADPDRLLAGKAYKIVAPEGGLVAGDVQPQVPTDRAKTQPDADTIVKDNDPRMLRYTAKAGDTVSSLALALLGSDDAVSRSIILNANASLKTNPDMVIEGKTYWIPAPIAQVSGKK